MSAKLLKYILLVLLPQQITTATNYLFSTPIWVYDCACWYGENFIPDASTSFHVTGIVLGLCSDGAIYTVNILGDGITRTAIPSSGSCTLSATNILSVGATERVAKIEAWRNTVSGRWYRIKLTLNSGIIREYYPAGYNSASDTLHTFTVPAG